MPELLKTLAAHRKNEESKMKFQATIQGVEFGSEEPEETSTFDDIKRRAMGINASADDVVSLQGDFASQAGFGIGQGLGYSQE